jgi:hypothetical protein
MEPLLLNLAQFAALAAQMDVGVPKPEVLGAARVSDETWAASQVFWLQRMAEQSGRGNFSLSERYARFFADYRVQCDAKRSAERRPLAGSLSLAPRPVVPAAPAPPVPPPPLLAPPLHPLSSRPPPVVHTPTGQALPGPWEGAAAAPTTLDVQQFAAIRAELAVAPEAQHPAIRERYHLDESAWRREEAAWQARLHADGPLLQAYLTHFRYLRALLGPRG